MAETLDPKPDTSSENPNPPTPQSENPNPNSDPPTNPNLTPTIITPPSFPPSFRPLMPPQYSTLPNHSVQPPPGVSYGSVTVSAPPIRYPPPPNVYGQAPSNGFMAVPPPGVPRYPGPYPTMVRPGFPPCPMPPMGLISQIPRPPIPGIRGVPPMVPPIVRPTVPAVAATEKPQTTVYVGKIASTVDNDFMLSLLRLCGPVKSWKRAQDPSNGTPKGFGFCEFEAAEGILRAVRLLTKLNIDGQELVLNINQTTREYLDRYVEKKTEREKLKEAETQTLEKVNEGGTDIEKQEPSKTAADEKVKVPDDSGDKDKENHNFGIVTDEDREADKEASEKIISMIEERLKTNPLPPPPPPPPLQTPGDGSVKSNSDKPSKSRDGDSDVGVTQSAEGKIDDEITSETKPATENDKLETSSPDKGRKNEKSSREKDRERDKDRDSKRERERELERYERERERERVRREKERDLKIRETERLYNNRLKEWEAREREQEHQRLKEKEREKDRQRERRREISKDEDGSDNDEDDTRKRRRRRNTLEEKRRKRQREKEDDLADRLKEVEEIAEAKKRAIEEQVRIEEMNSLPDNYVYEESENVSVQVDDDNMIVAGKEAYISAIVDDNDYNNNIEEELPDIKQNNEAPAKKLGFGLLASGKKTAVPSVFHPEDDENIEDKKMRPLIPIDYSTEELQAVQTTTVSSTPPNLVAAAEFAKRISGVNNNPKEERPEMERERIGRSNDRGRHRERDRNENKEKIRDRSYDREREDKPKTENKKLLDAKQLIDMIPKTKEELFSYEINWAVCDKHDLHEKMRPWISKKITEFLGEEEETLVDYIVSSTKDHVQASKMLELLQSILDDEAEMFVLKMWRMLIFEIKKVETGLSVKPKA